MDKLNIPQGSRVYLDSSILIYTVEVDLTFWKALEVLWRKFAEGEISLISSELIITEVLVKPLKSQNEQSIDSYNKLLFDSGIELIPITRSLLISATNLRAKHNLKTPDAIHAATSIDLNCNRFLTNDKGFTNIPRLPTLILSQIGLD
ncbi:type II toxin-antitoxin system VapC family toxin [Chamaesiphon minutus]|uniref:Putative nucleic acid-binding protein, contains PIN domain n=1 Tax=Chamaesiphon minutus (strain ATCC 27169 / PCC 6605) TaxID=1173020 RepID=K9ULN5_CHAP6|nr:type II toxin-antitoxin system VapC family toxin [Chamaesiphon minutus]AFY95725.1 putative nucleic acid-binding protein, contains PIN domain [Chamaesiphon minutus PCC 6605]